MADLQKALKIEQELGRLDEAYTPRRNEEYELRVDMLRQEFRDCLMGLQANYVHVTSKRKVTTTPATLGIADIQILCESQGSDSKKHTRIVAYGEVNYGKHAVTPIWAPIDLEAGQGAGGCHYELVAAKPAKKEKRVLQEA